MTLDQDTVLTEMEPVEIEAVGQRLRHVRQTKRLRLRHLAERIGCSESILSKIECGKVNPSLRMLHRVAAALETSIVTLFSASEEKDLAIYRSGER
jgi:transcriptional regulator with XRE-family HTH domain